MSDFLFARVPSKVAMKLVCGPMFAGKTSRLITEHLSLSSVPHALFSPAFDTRYEAGVIRSHTGSEISGVIPISGDDILLHHLRVISAQYQAYRAERLHIHKHPVLGCLNIFIDEIQFFDIQYNGTFLDTLKEWAQTFNKETSIPVVLKFFGLDMDTDRRVWPLIRALSEEDAEVEYIKARCTVCGSPASYTIRTDGAPAKHQVGGASLYEPRCERHLPMGLR